MQISNSELLVTIEITYLITGSFPWQWRQDVAETSDLSIISLCGGQELTLNSVNIYMGVNLPT